MLPTELKIKTMTHSDLRDSVRKNPSCDQMIRRFSNADPKSLSEEEKDGVLNQIIMESFGSEDNLRDHMDRILREGPLGD